MAVSAIVGVGAASAADLPVYTKAPPIVAPVYDWSGGYIGIEGGGGWGHSDQTDVRRTVADGHFSVSGGLFGGTLGYNWQTGPWVFGLEGDYSWSDISGQSNICGFGPPHPCGTKLESLGTFRGRIGHTVGAMGSWLLYGTGGLAVGDVHGWDSLFPASGSAFRAGWTVGAGVETSFAPHWTAKLEYLYVDLGKSHLFDVVPGVPETVSFRANIVRVGVNYSFSGPVVAKY
ncbi:outer membrane beta-barrel protein [Bradyrhizobium sp.]|uniref:outer membrane protein n=1 Tax=Bradyrhizobium sp. TaxID=376 RepID=UPI0025BFAB6C|nr:outer membrane beta-barrel protein [Bradyrhizobium sp.]